VKYLKTLLACMALLLTSACAQIGLQAANLPTHFSSSKLTRNIVFDPATKLALDIYIPPETSPKARPVIVFFYGGRWESGEKESYRFVGDALAQKGFITVIPDYRKYPNIRFPAFVEDAAKAVAWVHDNIENYGGTPARIYVTGHSSGAHLGALITADEHYLKALNQPPHVIKAFAGLAGPYAFTPNAPDLEDMFGPPANYPTMMVTNFIDGHEAPMLLLYGDRDEDVGRFNLDRLKKRIEEKGGRVETKIYPGIDHKWIVAAMSWLGRNKAPVIDDMAEYFKTH